MTESLLKPYRMGILLLLISFGTIAAVIFTPALPGLEKEFGISASQAQLTMSVFLVGYSVGQLLYGPLANRFGRKKAVYCGIGLMLVGSVLSMLAPSFGILVFARFVQALGAAVGLKITFTMISDQHVGPTATKAVSFLSLAFAVMPALGVTIGGFITEYWGWRGCFVFLSFYAVLMAWLVSTLPETAKVLDREALRGKKIVSGYLRQFKRRETLVSACLMGLISSTFYLFATLSPFVGISRIGLSPDQFGLWNLLLPIGLFGGVFFTQWYSEKESPSSAIFIGSSIMFLFSLSMFVFFSFSIITVWTLFIPATLMRLGSNVIWATASTDSLSSSSDKSNTSAVMQFINMSLSTLSVFLAEGFSAHDHMLLPSALLILTTLLLIVWKFAWKKSSL